MQPRRSSDGEKSHSRTPIVIQPSSPNLPDLNNPASVFGWIADKGVVAGIAVYLLVTFTQKMDLLAASIQANTAVVSTFVVECGRLVGPTR
jgi:hypothetical protein